MQIRNVLYGIFKVYLKNTSYNILNYLLSNFTIYLFEINNANFLRLNKFLVHLNILYFIFNLSIKFFKQWSFNRFACNKLILFHVSILFRILSLTNLKVAFLRSYPSMLL